MRINSYEKATQLFAKGATVAQVKKQLKIKDAKTPWLYRAKKRAAAAATEPLQDQAPKAPPQVMSQDILAVEMRRIAQVTNQIAIDMIRLKMLVDLEREAWMGK